MESPSKPQYPPKLPHAKNESNEDHNAGRRMRELYRYFRPGSQPDLNFDSNSQGRSSGDHTDLDADEVLAVHPPSTAASESGGPARIGTTTVTPDPLILGGDLNKTLNSFAQLAALRINAQRAVVRFVFDLCIE